MKEWLENPKNKKIVLIVCPIIMLAAIALVVVQTGIIAPQPPAQVIPTGHSPANSAAAPGAPPGAPGSPGATPTPGSPSAPVEPHVAGAPPAPGRPGGPGESKTAANPAKHEEHPGKAENGHPGPNAKLAKGEKPGAGPAKPKPVMVAKAMQHGPGGPGASGMPGAPGAPGAAGTPAVSGPQPPQHVRPDPFRPYKNIALVMAASRASIASYTFPLIARLPGMENPTAEPGAAPVPGGENQPAAQQAQAPVLLPWKVAGIMTGQAGIKAIVMNGDQSAVLQAGDPLPDGTANVVSITPTGVIVRTTGAVHRTVKLDANDNNSSPTNNQGQPNMGQPGMPMPGGPGGAMPGMPNRGFPGGRPPGAV